MVSKVLRFFFAHSMACHSMASGHIECTGGFGSAYVLVGGEGAQAEAVRVAVRVAAPEQRRGAALHNAVGHRLCLYPCVSGY